jgi:anaerobic selenocysteine-containing dehydrogenase
MSYRKCSRRRQAQILAPRKEVGSCRTRGAVTLHARGEPQHSHDQGRALPDSVHAAKRLRTALGIKDGERIRIANAQGSIEAIASGSEDIRAGVVSIAHCWGQDDGDAGDVATRGVNINRLLRCDLEFDAITGQPTMSAVPVMISPA